MGRLGSLMGKNQPGTAQKHSQCEKWFKRAQFLSGRVLRHNFNPLKSVRLKIDQLNYLLASFSIYISLIGFDVAPISGGICNKLLSTIGLVTSVKTCAIN